MWPHSAGPPDTLISPSIREKGIPLAGTAPRLPEQFRSPDPDMDFNVSELVSDAAGAHSPFGDTQFPLPAEELTYKHPRRADRPHLADGR